MTKAKIFRESMHAEALLQIPCCYDGASAKVIQAAGFKAVGAAGYGLSGSLLGMPDIGVLTVTEMVAQYANICDAVDIPVFVDLDTGFGDVNNVVSAVRAAEKAGVAALFIEDQTFPKRCGHMAGKGVVPVDEYLPKLRAALWARRDPDLVIMARTDARGVLGLDEALRRARLYAEAGADACFVESVETEDEMRAVNDLLRGLGTPSMANMIEGGRTPLKSARELQDLGYSIAAYPCGAIFSAMRAVQGWADHLMRAGRPDFDAARMMSFDEYFGFIGATEIRERENGFFAPPDESPAGRGAVAGRVGS